MKNISATVSAIQPSKSARHKKGNFLTKTNPLSDCSFWELAFVPRSHFIWNFNFWITSVAEVFMVILLFVSSSMKGPERG